MNVQLRPRAAFFLAALACIAILGFAFYLQYVKEMEPCPLCWFQRLAVGGLAIVFAIGAWRCKPRIQGPTAAWVAVCITVVALAGAGVSARHIWIQNLPADQVPACGQGIGYMLESMPFLDVFSKALKGSGECAKRDTWIGLTLPTWTILFFAGCIVWAWWAAFLSRRDPGFR